MSRSRLDLGEARKARGFPGFQVSLHKAQSLGKLRDRARMLQALVVGAGKGCEAALQLCGGVAKRLDRGQILPVLVAMLLAFSLKALQRGPAMRIAEGLPAEGAGGARGSLQDLDAGLEVVHLVLESLVLGSFPGNRLAGQRHLLLQLVAFLDAPLGLFEQRGCLLQF